MLIYLLAPGPCGAIEYRHAEFFNSSSSSYLSVTVISSLNKIRIQIQFTQAQQIVGSLISALISEVAFRHVHGSGRPQAGSGQDFCKVRWVGWKVLDIYFCLLFTALNGMQTWSSDENSVCVSVRPSFSVCQSVKRVNYDKTEERSVQIVIPHQLLSQFSEKNGWWGRSLLPEILGQPAAVGAKSPILNRYSLVAPQP